jgi:hypothetical protein
MSSRLRRQRAEWLRRNDFTRGGCTFSDTTSSKIGYALIMLQLRTNAHTP